MDKAHSYATMPKPSIFYAVGEAKAGHFSKREEKRTQRAARKSLYTYSPLPAY